MSLLRATGSRAAERPRGANRGGHRRLLTGLVAVVTAIAATCLTVPGAAAASPPSYRPPAGAPDFGPNVKIFDPTMPIADIQATVDAVYAEQVDNEMGTQRYSLLFKPGTYGTVDAPVIFKVGYYTEVAGLGSSPTDVTINGHVDVYNRCFDFTTPEPSNLSARSGASTTRSCSRTGGGSRSSSHSEAPGPPPLSVSGTCRRG